MAFVNTNTRTAKPTSSENNLPLGRMPALFGLYIGFVKNAKDVQKNGRLAVWIPEFGSAPDIPAGWVTVNYCSPFAGATNVSTISRTDQKTFENTQTSYGMWAVPPDINNEVLVMFINGDPAKGVWIGCMYNQFVNNMVPTVPANSKNWQYPGKAVPSAEYNKWDTSATIPDNTSRPYDKTKFDGVGNQGLIRDSNRGITSTSARRESPSQAFGIATPGPAIDPTAKPENIRRKGGHSFVMDDGTGSEYIQLATKTGAQVKIDETNGFVYLINRDGTAWVQMDKHGNVDIFGANNISMRAQRDINLRADRNVNIEAGQNVFIKAAKDSVETTTTFTHDVNNTPTRVDKPVWKFVGEGNGDGGNIVTHALNDWHSTTKKNAYLTVLDDDMNIVVNNMLVATTISGGQDFNSRQGIKLTTQGSFDVAAASTIKVAASDHVSIASPKNVMLCSKGQLSLNGDNAIALRSYTEIGLTGETILSSNTWFNEDIMVRKQIKTQRAVKVVKDIKPKSAVLPLPPQRPHSARTATMAAVRGLVEKLNVLPTWTNDSEKFVRNSQSISTTVSRFPTYEPCPEHEHFKMTTTTGRTTVPDEVEYVGSGGSGNTEVTQPPSPTAKSDAGDNQPVIPQSYSDTSVAGDLDMDAFKCQLTINEGRKNVSYNDSRGLLTGGIGHLMRAPVETSKYPLGTPISIEQIDLWYQADASAAIRDAASLIGSEQWDKLSDVRKRAVADLCYNMGKAKVAKFTKFLAAFKTSNWVEAGAQLKDSLWFKQVASRGPRIITMIVQDIDPHNCTKKGT